MCSDKEQISIFKNKESKEGKQFISKHKMIDKINKKKINNNFKICSIKNIYKMVLFSNLN